MSAAGSDYLWGVSCPARMVAAALPAIVDWCRSRRVERPMLVGGRSLSAAPRGLALLHGLEAAGLAVWAFDRGASPSLAVVADAVASYHFEGCDALVAVGGGTAVEVAKGAALMVGQRSPYRALVPDPGDAPQPVDASSIPPLLAVPATAAGAAAACAALWIADDAGVARPFRHPALRPLEAVLADDLIAAVPLPAMLRSAAVLALLAADAGADDAEVEGLLAARQPDELMRSALGLAANLEAAAAPARRIALTAAATAGVDFAGVLLALVRRADWTDAACRRLAPTAAVTPDATVIRAARWACGPADAGPVDALLAAAGLEFGETPRRRGRRGRVQ